ncbi:Asp/Glu racemase [Salipiger sp.]|uniref:maleate cis-trans isomerase family protein n=1 Tax=Salipiger sp. TaxID=2078585 RepID=UPI003A97D008
MTRPFPHSLTAAPPVQIGLVVLQSDETLELDFRRLIPTGVELFATRVPSGDEVTPETLAAMEAHLSGAAALFPRAARFAAVGYGCTSGTAQIGAAEVARQIRAGCRTRAVTEPVSALVAACRALGVTRMALLSPYVETVSRRLQQVLAAQGIATPVFGSFEVAEEARVARIDGASIMTAAESLLRTEEVDALFLSCTNLRTLDIIPALEARLGLPVLSSNQVLAWHLMEIASVAAPAPAPGQLFARAGARREA